MKLLVALILSTRYWYTVESNTCGSSMAGVILQDQDAAADLNKFNSTNQNVCIDAETYPGVFSDRELFSKTYLRKTASLQERFCMHKFRFRYFGDC